ncbi:hypothetical protein P8452_77099 [Trifolium repens]|nr:hypothetical protein P8452_77099 [Trifolium repens]
MVVSEFAVGINKRVDKVMDLLQVRSNGVKVLGLYGMGGVGKTALAKALFNSLVGRFERRCFISNVRQFSSKEDGLVSLQSNVIKGLSPENAQSVIGDVNAGISVIKRIIRENRVLLVLDDVDNVNQLDALIGKFLPDELKWLQWQGCPLEGIPLDTLPRELAVLDLSNGQKIKSLRGLESHKVPENLMVINLSDCYRLAAIPDLSRCLRLEKINLERCINLKRIHESIGSLTTLRNFNLTHCEKLIELPSDVSGLKHLESLFLSKCYKLKALPENIGILKSLKTLFADETAIVKLP